MISILLPVYNHDVRPFVRELHEQAKACETAFEIRCYDDASEEDFRQKNRGIKQLSNVQYLELEQNIGRSAIRNRLAKDARYDHLLFLDADSSPASRDFIRAYLDQMAQHPEAVIYGGRSYEEQPPKDPSRYFRWFYGMRREVTPLSQRSAAPYHSFMTNNFLIPKKLFLSIRFDEGLSGYGHEDTLFGIELKKRKAPIIHIDNPLCHLGLETFEEYLEKTQEGLKNLALLIEKGKVDESVRIYRSYRKVKQFGLTPFVVLFYRTFKKAILKQLQGKKPQLKLFDFYKLVYLLKLKATQTS